MDEIARHRTAAIVLAGGRSSRLAAGMALPPGGKAALEISGRSLLDRAIDAAAVVTGRVIVVAAPGQPLSPTALRGTVVRDTHPGAGPLAALADGLAAAGAVGVDAALVVACDVPLVSPAVLALLVRRLLAADASRAWVVPRVGGHAQVLVSAMRPTLLGTVRDRLAGGTRAPRALLESLGGVPGAVEIVPEDELRAVEPALGSFFDLDTPGDLEELRRIEAARGET